MYCYLNDVVHLSSSQQSFLFMKIYTNDGNYIDMITISLFLILFSCPYQENEHWGEKPTNQH